jgi:50S ribosomal subunit-associated GTPase HflX
VYNKSDKLDEATRAGLATQRDGVLVSAHDPALVAALLTRAEAELDAAQRAHAARDTVEFDEAVAE